MFSAPENAVAARLCADGVPMTTYGSGTVDSWLVWQLTGGADICAKRATPHAHCCTTSPRWIGTPTCSSLRLAGAALPAAVASDQGFGTTSGSPGARRHTDRCRDGRFARRIVRPGLHRGRDGEGDLRHRILSHGPSWRPFSRRCADPGDAGLGIDGVAHLRPGGEHPFLRRTLAWAADLLTDGRVADLVALAETVPDSGGVTLVPAFSGLGAPHWDRNAHGLISGMSE